MNNKYQINSPDNFNPNYQNNPQFNSNYNNMRISSAQNISNLYRSNPPKKEEKKKLNFKEMKNNTICSLNEVEGFLNKLQHTLRCVKLFKLLK